MEATRTPSEGRVRPPRVGGNSVTAESSDALGAATGAIAVGASVLLGGLTLVVSTTGLVAMLATVMAHAGLLCAVSGAHLLLKRAEIAPAIRRAYVMLTLTLVLCTAGTDFAILVSP